MEQKPVLQISYSLANIENAVHQLWQYAHQYKVWAFFAEMGSGKTTLIHELCNMLGVRENVSSPTFALINEYSFEQEGTEQLIYHMDWYRIENEEEAVRAGVEDCLLHATAYKFIEWPERLPELLPEEYLRIEIENKGAEERELRLRMT